MDYNHILKFLDKFKKIIYQKEEIKNIIKEIISNEISYKIEDNSLVIKNGYIYIYGSPILRNEIIMRKKQILLKTKEALPNNNFLDIK